jgi:hypothetical protein
LAAAKTEAMLWCQLVQTYKAALSPEDGAPSLKEGRPEPGGRSPRAWRMAALTRRTAAPAFGPPPLTDRPAPGVLPPLPYPLMPPSSVSCQLGKPPISCVLEVISDSTYMNFCQKSLSIKKLTGWRAAGKPTGERPGPPRDPARPGRLRGQDFRRWISVRRAPRAARRTRGQSRGEVPEPQSLPGWLQGRRLSRLSGTAGGWDEPFQGIPPGPCREASGTRQYPPEPSGKLPEPGNIHP